ncbi:MAG: hypothetical protein PHC34_02500 [Candidatus Gastranaerophilales bacterium]|nr:hypothetical protein [Candidatus Gastranaerophilales bacterium]
MEISKLYPQFSTSDRRQQNVPVDNDRRSGMDRRVNVDNRLRQDIKQVKDTFEAFRTPEHKDTNNDSLKNIEAGALSTIPFFRRFFGVSEAYSNHEYFKAIGKLFIQLTQFHGDIKDVKSACKQLISFDFSKTEAQKPWGFIIDTPLENKPVFRTLAKYDKTLYDVKIFSKLLEKIGAEEAEYLEDGLIKFNGTKISKITARAFTRIPIMSAVFLSLLELPTVIKSKDKFKQTEKAAFNVASTVLISAFIGAGLAYFGVLPSLVGIFLGTCLASKLTKYIFSTN